VELHRAPAGVHQQKTSGAIRVFGLAGLEAGLADQRGLLIAEDAGYRHALHRVPAACP
jgi:hypothetical protein